VVGFFSQVLVTNVMSSLALYKYLGDFSLTNILGNPSGISLSEFRIAVKYFYKPYPHQR